MSVWDDDPTLIAEVVSLYLAGHDPTAIIREILAGRGMHLSVSQVRSKVKREGHIRRRSAGYLASRAIGSPRPSGAYGNMATRPSKLAPIRRALSTGPKHIADLVEMTGLSSHEASHTVRRLMELGEVENISPPGKRVGLYKRVKLPAPTIRGESVRIAEDAYVEARRAGATARELAQRMNLTFTAADRYESAFRAQTTSANQSDNSCPKFADHEKHLPLVWRSGGFPALTERRWAGGVAVCLPLAWPDARS